MRLFVLTALVAVFSFPVNAADISAKSPGATTVTSLYNPWFWEQVNNDDTTVEQKIVPGLYEFHVEGTEATVDLKLQHGKTAGSLEDIDTDSMTDGVRFNSASNGNSVIVCLGGGYADISFVSVGGATQDVDIWMTRLGDCAY